MTAKHERTTRVRYGLALPVTLLLLLLITGPATVAQQKGLRLTLSSKQNSEKKDVRTARMVALYVQAGRSASPFLPPGPFEATWKGALTFDDFGIDATFSARGTGHVKANVNGNVVLDTDLRGTDLVKGKTTLVRNGPNPLEVTYTAPEDGPARFRLYWSSRSFPPEPLPISQLQHKPDQAPASHQQRRTGRALFAEHRCVRCHHPPEGADLKMPELRKDAPDLAGAGSRFRQAWMADWIADPHKFRQETTMPAVLHGSSKKIEKRARDVAAYLSKKNQADSDHPDVNVTEKKIKRGRRHFRALGCVACHRLTSDQRVENQSIDRIPLAHVGRKWKPGALASFLKNPRKNYSWRPMPDFRLSTKHATDLAAFLLDATGTPDADGKTPTGNPKNGRKWFRKTGCNRCHAPDTSSTYSAPSLADLLKRSKDDLETGCLAPGTKKRGRAPNFDFTDLQRTSLRTFLTGDARAALSRFVPAEFTTRQYGRLRCANCHTRDGNYDSWSKLPDAQTDVELDRDQTWGVKQNRPPLTWTGEQLQYDWMKKMITGTLKKKPRPWLVARMPGFGVYGKHMARGLAAQHGLPPEPVRATEPDPEKGRAGRKIVNKLNCYSCHGVGDRKPNTFEVAGINFFKSQKRLRKEYTIRWLLNPPRIRPNTKMPSYFEWGKASPFPKIQDGKIEKQLEALWQYLIQVRKLEQ